jgi:hypothetical protein
MTESVGNNEMANLKVNFCNSINITCITRMFLMLSQVIRSVRVSANY